MNLGELRGWVEEKRVVLREEGLESTADFLVRLMVKDRFKGRDYTAEFEMQQLVEFMTRRCITLSEESAPREDREFADKKLLDGIQLAKMLGLTTEEIARATVRATRPLT